MIGPLGPILEQNQPVKPPKGPVFVPALAHKKDGTNGLAVRAGRPVTQTTPNLECGKLYRLPDWNIYTIA
jgi:hypothetical protein